MKQPSLFESSVDSLCHQMESICDQIERLPLEEQVEALNRVRLMLHRAGPFRDQPVDYVMWAPADKVQGNDYNPNSVAPPEMRLLNISIKKDGFTQSIVGWEPDGNEEIEVVDGFHRTRIGKEDREISRRLHGYLPISLIESGRTDLRDRMAATIRHNRARGVHGVMPMTDIVAELIRQGWTDDEVARELGMDADEVLRFKQNVGLPELFKRHRYSRSWE